MTESGSMRETIHLQAQSTAQDATGQRLLVWTDIGTRRAEKTATPGAEIWAGGERAGRVPTVFRIRYPRELDLSPKLRVVHLTRVFDVVSCVDPDGRRVDLLLTCDELVGEVAA